MVSTYEKQRVVFLAKLLDIHIEVVSYLLLRSGLNMVVSQNTEAGVLL
jgi:hypothetical protein